MSLERFAESRALTLGVELELQLVSLHDYDLTPAADDLLRMLGRRKGPGSVVPESSASATERTASKFDSSSARVSGSRRIIRVWRAGPAS